ncbi:MAG TPA: MOSC N-terminal beta barrel domain-containing protein [Pseudonocardia sp.]|nr:MOSC N-terminal beta barrel domain-containing protein [Pseudonocardia sp.]
MRVAELWRYPVKSLRGERLEAGELGPHGLHGDRQWAIFDVETGLGLTARREPELLHAAARVRDDGGVEITIPDGSVAADDAALSAWLGRPVELRDAGDTRRRRYENPEDIETESAESWYVFEGSDAAFHDSLAVTLLSVQTAGDAALARFRANVVLDTGGEDELVGSTVRVGAALLRVAERVPRCVMVTRPQPGGIGVDRDVLRRIHRERDGKLAVGAVVVRPGTVRVGDRLEVDAAV